MTPITDRAGLQAGLLSPLSDKYHSVAGQPAQALVGTAAGSAVGPLTLVDFIDDRIRGIDAERLRLCMVREQLTSAGVTMAVDDLRRLLG